MVSEVVDINEVVNDVARKLQTRSSVHRIVVDITNGLPLVKADQTRVGRILYNLMDNAIKYSPEGGVVEISARRDEQFMVVGVKDEGPGISPENQARLFQSFERLGANVNGSIQGIGLGLRVCKVLVEAQGGRIWVESTPGKGATFYFTLPLYK